MKRNNAQSIEHNYEADCYIDVAKSFILSLLTKIYVTFM